MERKGCRPREKPNLLYVHSSNGCSTAARTGVRFASWTLFWAVHPVPRWYQDGHRARRAPATPLCAAPEGPGKPQEYFTGLRAGFSLGARVGENVGHSPAPASQRENLGTAFDHLHPAMLAHHHTPPGVVAAPQWRSRSAVYWAIHDPAQVFSMYSSKLSISCRAGFDTTATRICRLLSPSTTSKRCRISAVALDYHHCACDYGSGIGLIRRSHSSMQMYRV